MNENIIRLLVGFRDRRDWERFHTGGELARALSIEAGELSELFLWGKDPHRELLAPELADVFIYATLLAHHHGIDIERAILDKIAINEKRYPVEKCRGSNLKYTELHKDGV